MLTAAAIVACGYVHGRWTMRWARSHEVSDAAERVQEFPLALGEWKGEDEPLEPRELAMTGAAGYFRRTYRNEVTQERVSVLLMVGMPRRVAVHTPDVCYRGAGFEAAGPEKKASMKIGKREAHFWLQEFTANGPGRHGSLRIFWSWNAGQGWEAPGNAPIHFARQAVLYKLYVQRQLSSPNEGSDEEVCERFLHTFLPELEARVLRRAG